MISELHKIKERIGNKIIIPNLEINKITKLRSANRWALYE